MKVIFSKNGFGSESIFSFMLSHLLERSKKKNILKSPEFLVCEFKICITDIFAFSSYKKILPNFSYFKLSFLLFLKFHILFVHFLGNLAAEENSNPSQRLMYVT